ncbi:MAG TPA: hypothetical protein ENJ10_05525 [Caldithrix abyssi]|uniref:Uncharacterized protein n=1 Tax=Caldithrix abyssi TaxID=187145 RepID=A0A7V1PU53_CALAY|nr:hypothetical protein [Caldithrix abyssi]
MKNEKPIPEEWQHLLMKALDEALTQEEQSRFEQLLESSTEFRHEWREFSAVHALTKKVRYKEPQGEIWDMYQTNVYHRIERGLSWFLTLTGILILTAYGLYEFVTLFLADPAIPGIVKIGVVFLGSGLVALFFSVVREKLFIRKNDPYREVER